MWPLELGLTPQVLSVQHGGGSQMIVFLIWDLVVFCSVSYPPRSAANMSLLNELKLGAWCCNVIIETQTKQSPHPLGT